MIGDTVGAVAFFTALAAVGVATHVALYGLRRAPAGRAYLSRRQWVTLGGIAAVPAGTFVVLLASAAARAAVAGTFGAQAPGAAVAFSLLALGAVACGVAPSLRGAEEWAGSSRDA